MKKYLPFVAFWLLNSILLNLATFARPLNFVLGNFWLTKGAATFWTGFWLTVIVWLARLVMTKLKLKLEGRGQMFIFYWACNSVAIWLLARLADFTGFGISRFTWAIGLGFILNFAQLGLWQGLKTYKLVDNEKAT